MLSLRLLDLATTLAIGITVVLPPAWAEMKNPPVSSALADRQSFAVAPEALSTSDSPGKYVPILALPIALGIAIFLIKDKNI